MEEAKKNQVYCVNCGGFLESFPQAHDCIAQYGKSVQAYTTVLKDYENSVEQIETVKAEIEKAMLKLGTLDSQILLEKKK